MLAGSIAGVKITYQTTRMCNAIAEKIQKDASQ